VPRSLETQVTDLKQVVGVWDGVWTARGAGAPTMRVRLSVQQDGVYTLVFPQNPTYSAQLRVVDGVLRSGALFPRGWDWAGVVTLADEGGAEHLIWRLNDGKVIGEFSRAK
jgi:hypothetical protein